MRAEGDCVIHSAYDVLDANRRPNAHARDIKGLPASKMSVTRSLQFVSNLTRRAYNKNLSAWGVTLTRGKPFSAAASPETQLSVTEGGKQLQAIWNNRGSGAEPSTYHAVWLRHGCQCPRCISKYNQLLSESHELDPDIKISEVKLTGIAS